MGTKNIVLVGGASAIGVIAYLYFNKKNKAIDALPVITPSQSAESLILPESTAIKASEVVIPPTAVVLPTANLVVQSSVIQEEDINSLDCASLMLKYNAVNKQFESLATTEGSSSSNVAVLRFRIGLIKDVMNNKNCVVKDPVLESAIIEQKIIAPPKYTNAEINEMVDSYFNDWRNEYQQANAFDQQTSSVENNGQFDRISSRNLEMAGFYTNSVALKDLLKTFPTKEEVNTYLRLFRTIGFATTPLSQYGANSLRNSLSTSDLAFARQKGFKI